MLIKNNFKILGDKDHDMEHTRELYEYQSPPHQQQHQLPPQAVQIAPTHPHLRHVGHPQTSIICIQPNHHPTTIITNGNQSSSASQVSVQTSQQSNEQLHEKMEHFHHPTNGGDIRPSVIESNQPMIIECT